MLVRLLCSLIDKKSKNHGQNIAIRNEANPNDDVFGEEHPQTLKRPIAYTLISFWGYLEVFMLAVVFLVKTKDFPNNFLHGFCTYSFCDRAISIAIVYKIASSIFLIIGCETVMDGRKAFFSINNENVRLQEITLFMMPWFIINVSGIFPLWTVVVSSFYSCM